MQQTSGCGGSPSSSQCSRRTTLGVNYPMAMTICVKKGVSKNRLPESECHRVATPSGSRICVMWLVYSDGGLAGYIGNRILPPACSWGRDIVPKHSPMHGVAASLPNIYSFSRYFLRLDHGVLQVAAKCQTRAS